MSVASTSIPAPVKKSGPVGSFLTSSIGKKWIVALTGLGLLAFVVGHMLGNLQFFLPNKQQINDYGVHLRELGPLLWIIRFGLLAIFVLHIVTTVQLVIANKRARPEKYAVTKPTASTLASRTMIFSGLLVLAFVIYHLLHFTFLATHPSYRNLHDPSGHHDVYSMMVLGFQQPMISVFYIISVTLLALHLNHGIASTLQTLGLNTHRLHPFWKNLGRGISVIIGVGYLTIPLSVLAGIQKLPPWFTAPH